MATQCIECGRMIAIPNLRAGRTDGSTGSREGPFCILCAAGDTIRFRSSWFYPTAFCAWGPEETDAVHRVLRSGRLTMGDEVAAFEAEFAAWHGKRHAIMVNSGSSANLVAVAALFHVKHQAPLKRGDTAVVPALAWATTYAPLVQHGLGLALSDCDASWNAEQLDPSAFDNGQPRLVIACSILGNPGHLAEWKEWAGIQGAYLIEDNCESLGARTAEGDLCGTFGLMSTFSFFHSHQVGAVEGGMVLTDDDECASLCRMLRDHGWSRSVEPAAGFDREYDFRLFGYNLRPLELHAAVAREQLRKLPGFIEARRANLVRFWEAAVEEALPIVAPEPRGFPSPFGIHFLLSDPEARPRVAEGLRRAGIDCRLPTGGSFRQHAYGAPWRDQATPVADAVHRGGLFIGNGPLDLTPQIARAVRTLKEVL